ncbi:1,4-dihydroxy-6-naphthoate synthase [Desulfopila sp. IMCC35006]|uniref:1,4-dihydroxy-6-naphthoate synthase n=1 Tax=Desulfopila sp. IMCC35006 TaxID=2569542 RepID=UPI0010AD6690|nr:1,4-dihydroxy-6-naphthoate synthase [Desulfopila sp. IMCC35006]TKB24157.1 1,4-dihydroxy-6-naphthoate synthase [Desulfopila sp. IMCC35006]
MTNELSLGFSPCPNDTFIFYGLVHGMIEMPDAAFAPPVLADVEQLNMWALDGKLDVTKLSFHALGHVLDEYCLLSAGSALGRGCGPLLIAAARTPLEDVAAMTIAIPGKLTTAALLLQMFLPDCHRLVEMRFDHIMGAVKSGAVDAGVIIHESRFTYGEQGLFCLQDLGLWWEESTGLPIPLGCIAARRSLGSERIMAIDQAIRASVDYSFAHPDASLPYIRSNSQELAPDIVRSHIELYVNDFSKNLGQEGEAAVQAFLQRGRRAGVLPDSMDSNPPLTI